MTEIRRRFTGAHTLQVESRTEPNASWKPVSHLVALGYESPYTPGWEVRHAIGYGGRPGTPVLPFQPLSVRHYGSDQDDYRLTNPLSAIPSQSPLSVPAGAEALNYQPRLGFVIAKDLADATPEEASTAIAAFVLLCEFHIPNGNGHHAVAVVAEPPSSIAGSAVSAKEMLDCWQQLTGAVAVNGQVVSELRSPDTGPQLGEMVAAASSDQHLNAGELFSIDALAPARATEPLKRGDHLVVAVPRLGRIEHSVS